MLTGTKIAKSDPALLFEKRHLAEQLEEKNRVIQPDSCKKVIQYHNLQKKKVVWYNKFAIKI